MLDWPAIISAIVALATALGIKELVTGWAAKRNGDAQSEKERYQEVINHNDILQNEKNELLEDNRKQKEYSSQLRRLLIEHGVSLNLIPEWPKENHD